MKKNNSFKKTISYTKKLTLIFEFRIVISTNIWAGEYIVDCIDYYKMNIKFDRLMDGHENVRGDQMMVACRNV